MHILNYDEIKLELDRITDEIIRGAVFIHPTDTIYGIGCNALKSASVKKIRQLKDRAENPFSVIAPSLEWIKENCIVTKDAEQWLEKLPGPYTFILKLKKECVAKEVNMGLKTLGVRIPNHWMRKIVADAEVPVVTTSVNRSGEDYMTSIEDIDSKIKSGIEFALYEGKKEGKPSKIVDLTSEMRIIER